MSSIFIFRRDFRLDDNTGLIKACKESDKVYPIFIINSNQVTDKNSYKSQNSIQFMHESLKELESLTNHKLSFFYGSDDVKILNEIINHKNDKKNGTEITKIYSNLDYTPYAKERDKKIKDFCQKKSIEFIQTEDYTLTPIESVLTDSGKPYTKYTPYHNKAAKQTIPKPDNFTKSYLSKLTKLTNSSKDLVLPENSDRLEKYYTPNSNINIHGGRSLGLNILKNAKTFDNYIKNRNDLTYKTTFLSGYIKFGCVSLREVYDAFRHNSSLVNELFWHDFYAQAIHFNPKVLEGKSMDERFDKIKWSGTHTLFEKWCNGETGFPVVDAAMIQLNTTGFMHNRARMIVASFLVKTLLCNWRWGEKYFAQKLLDYDPCSNVGGWLWTAGGGFDSQPYFRIFNPWTQSEKFDVNAEYIKHWIPSLKDIPAKDLHNWNESYSKYPNNIYFKPCVDYSANRIKALETYKKSL
jgi:deoxyribodipyrimidine photo-lyase